MEQINLYKLVLDNWYWNRFNSIRDYQKTIIHLNSMSPSSFTKDFRTIQMNLGRQQGATTAILDFIKEHKDLNIVYIGPNKHCLSNFESDLKEFYSDYKTSSKIKLYSYDNLKGCNIYSNIDIVFIDVVSYMTDRDKVYLETLLSNLNYSYNKNQWVIKFG